MPMPEMQVRALLAIPPRSLLLPAPNSGIFSVLLALWEGYSGRGAGPDALNQI
jgi:hypothetical protein